jgi:tape measure domain-containing protein
MIVRELITKLGWSLDRRGPAQFDRALNNMQSKAETFALGIQRVMVGVAGAIAAAAAPIAVARAGDEMTAALAKLSDGLGSAERGAEVYERLYESARRTGAVLTDSVQAFGVYNMAVRGLGGSAEDTVKLLGGMQSAMAVLGTTGQQASSMMLQLGQALTDTLRQEEINSLNDAMPQLIEHLRTSLGMTAAQFREAAEKGELTAARIYGPLITFSEEYQKRLNRQVPMMSRSMAIMGTTIRRTLADIDRELGISSSVARWLQRASDALERFRQRLPSLGRFVDSLGGMKNVLELVAYSLGIATAALLAFRGAAIGAWLAAAGPWVLLVAGIALAGAMLQDFVKYVQGNTAGTLFGKWFGDFETLIAPVKAGLESVCEWLESTSAAVNASLEEMRGFIQRGFTAMATAVTDAWSGIGQFFDNLWNGITSRFERALAIIQPLVDRVTAAARFLNGTGAGSDPAAQGERRGNMGGRGALGGFPDPMLHLQNFNEGAAGRIGGTGGVSNVSATQTINQEINIQATGISPAEVAAGSQAGVRRANSDGKVVWAEFARSIGVANPRTEPGTA